jgi:hypothetical protein
MPRRPLPAGSRAGAARADLVPARARLPISTPSGGRRDVAAVGHPPSSDVANRSESRSHQRVEDVAHDDNDRQVQ